MTKRRRSAMVALLGAIPILLSAVLPISSASAHGSTMNPPSRTYQCRFNESPESPTSAACRAAVAAGGTQAFYDWHEVNLPNVAGNHRAFIPDGQLCGAGRAKYTGLNLARDDWPATRLTSGANFTFQVKATAAHLGVWTMYVTRDGYNPLTPLRWSDLVQFHQVTNPPISNGVYQIATRLPSGKSGRHLIYTIWQRQMPDSGEAFYLCNDVIF
ncbi:lytic polysaccharide monooxygenase [Kibdelosporangium persicum]|uniref:Chitin-binding protein CbpD n=1 Tax=Kibdelosporangium persicum TaxID=2698649 RepID=A0ABX2FHR6_9PSEU|nr:lytic polysaccharide monooxygenase [Kibdelosporangium persicum]NRN70288.1 Chitin-binding protein CbpD [Kibdelosporangium persicum]